MGLFVNLGWEEHQLRAFYNHVMHVSCKLIVNAIVQCLYGVIKHCKHMIVKFDILHCNCRFYNTGYYCKLCYLELCMPKLKFIAAMVLEIVLVRNSGIA